MSNPPSSQAPRASSADSTGLKARIFLVAGTLVVCIVLLEFGLRVAGRYRSEGVMGFLAARGVSYGLKANVSHRVSWPTLSFLVCTDDLGFRSKKPGQRTFGDRPYYAVLGSSEVFGNGLDYADTLIGVFGERMHKNGVGVVNMAAPGHHLLEQVSLFKQFAGSAKELPDKVLICLNPLFIGGYDDIHKDAQVKMGHLMDKSSGVMSMAKLFISNLSASYCFLRDSIRNAQLKHLGRKDYDLSFYIERYSPQHPVRSAARKQDFLSQLKELEDYIRSLNATPVCIYLPAVGGFLLNDLKKQGKLDGTLFETTFFPDLIRDHCKAEGIQFIDVEPLLQARYDKGEKLNFDLDAHFNGPTSQILGDFIYESLQSTRRTEWK